MSLLESLESNNGWRELLGFARTDAGQWDGFGSHQDTCAAGSKTGTTSRS
jgi:hypothetical protein